MAAPGSSTSGSGSIRLRLLFDYPPPTTTGCRMCWLLVDLSACRVVADLESTIREKFGFSRRSIFHLFVEDCYLPHTESIYVVRDNDSVRVKVESVSQVNGLSSGPDTTKCKKRCRDSGEEGQESDGARVKKKKKKRRKKKDNFEESTSESSKQASADGEIKRTERKKKKKKKMVENSSAAAAPPVRASRPAKIPKKPQAAQGKSQKPASSDSSSDEDEAPMKTSSSTPAAPKPAAAPPVGASRPAKIPKKPQAAQGKSQKPTSPDSSSSDEDEAPQKAPSSTPAAPRPAAAKPGSNSKPAQKVPVSSSSTDSSSDETPAVKIPPKSRPPLSATPESQQAPPGGKSQSVNRTQNQSASVGQKASEAESPDSEEEIQLVIRRPQLPARGRGWGGKWRGGPAEHGRSVGGQRSFGSRCDADQEPSCRTDCLTNKSIILQNGGDSVPKRDYSVLPLLAAPPAAGQKIAFKLLELTENYTPEVSEYKEGTIVSFDPTSRQIELELQSASQAPVEPGKFDLVYQNADGSESVEYAVSRGCWVTERWESLLEPRLII